MNKLITLLLAAMALFIIGCSEDEVEVDPLVGTWNFTSMSILIGTATAGLTEELCNGSSALFPTAYGYTISWENDACNVTTTDIGYTMSWILNADYTLSLQTENTVGTIVTVTGTWSTSGTMLTLTSDDPDDTPIVGTYAVNGNTLDFSTLVSYTDDTSFITTYTFTKE